MNKIIQSITFLLLIIFFTNCKKGSETIETQKTYVECVSKKDSLILNLKSKENLSKIFLGYKIGMDPKQFQDLSEKYINDGTIKKHNGIFWFPLLNNTETDKKQYFEISPVYENNRLVEINLDSPVSHPDYYHFQLLSEKYGKPYYDYNCEFIHESFWGFQNIIISYIESNSEKNSQHISYSEINYAKKKSANFIKKDLTEEQKRIKSELKIKDSINKKKNTIKNAF